MSKNDPVSRLRLPNGQRSTILPPGPHFLMQTAAEFSVNYFSMAILTTRAVNPKSPFAWTK